MSELPLVRGFRFAALPCGIKKKAGALDVALLVADEPVPSAAVLTRNLVRAAPCELTAERVEGGKLQAVLVNAGCANAATGKEGAAAAKRAAKAVADALGVDEALVAPSSTGVIGVVLPAEKIVARAGDLVADLAPNGARRFAEAICTTDRWTKTASVKVKLGRAEATLLGIAKGAGMIHPDMATTLGYVVTDAKASPAFLRRALREATARTFNRISVDGDTSTNDTLVVMASGAAGNETLTGRDAPSERFVAALADVLESLARSIVRDGEGAEHVVRFEVVGATSDAVALTIARSIATSPLVKTALHGCDPNWGRILAAAGRAGVAFEPNRADVVIADVPVFRKGSPCMDEATEKRASVAMKQAEYTVTVRVGRGKGRAHYDTCDLGHEYVRINADYRS